MTNGVEMDDAQITGQLNRRCGEPDRREEQHDLPPGQSERRVYEGQRRVDGEGNGGPTVRATLNAQPMAELLAAVATKLFTAQRVKQATSKVSDVFAAGATAIVKELRNQKVGPNIGEVLGRAARQLRRGTTKSPDLPDAARHLAEVQRFRAEDVQQKKQTPPDMTNWHRVRGKSSTSAASEPPKI